MTGGSGLLGGEIKKLDSEIMAPSHTEFDITSLESVRAGLEKYKPEVVLHLAAATKPPDHEKSPVPGLTVNIIGTANLALICHELSIKLVYTSTDYLYVGPGPHNESEPVLPPYKFAWSKLGGECAVSLLPAGLILRLSFGPTPFPWDKVYNGQYNSKLYVDEMAVVVLAMAKSAATGIINIGGPRTSLEAYARRTKNDIETIPKPEWVPEDTSLNVSKMRSILDLRDIKSLFKH